jgi:hypothetical protein
MGGPNGLLSTKTVYEFLFSPVRAEYSGYIGVLGSVILIILGEAALYAVPPVCYYYTTVR